MRKNQFANLHAFAARLGKLDDRFRTPRDFFIGKSAEYIELASRIARGTLSALRPDTTSATDWSLELETLVASITAELLSPAGLELRIGSRQRVIPEVSSSDGVVYDMEEVRKWVLAGMERQPGAKLLDEDDEEILRKHGTETGSRIIAARVRRAYYSGNRDAGYERLREALRAFIGASSAEQADETLLAVAAAWEQAFIPRVREDLAAWMAAEAREALR